MNGFFSRPGSRNNWDALTWKNSKASSLFWWHTQLQPDVRRLLDYSVCPSIDPSTHTFNLQHSIQQPRQIWQPTLRSPDRIRIQIASCHHSQQLPISSFSLNSHYGPQHSCPRGQLPPQANWNYLQYTWCTALQSNFKQIFRRRESAWDTGLCSRKGCLYHTIWGRQGQWPLRWSLYYDLSMQDRICKESHRNPTALPILSTTRPSLQ